MSGPEEILSYWFPPGYDAEAETLRQQIMRWFRGGPEVDEEIAARLPQITTCPDLSSGESTCST